MGVDVNGFKIEISADIESKITSVDDAIERIQKNAPNAASGINSIKTALAGIDATQIQAVAKAVQQLAGTQVGQGFKDMEATTKNMLTNVTEIVTKLSQVSKGTDVTIKSTSTKGDNKSSDTKKKKEEDEKKAIEGTIAAINEKIKALTKEIEVETNASTRQQKVDRRAQLQEEVKLLQQTTTLKQAIKDKEAAAEAKNKLLSERQILIIMQSKAQAENEANKIYQRNIQLKKRGEDLTEKEAEYMFILINRAYALTTQLEKQQRINPESYYLAARKHAEQLLQEEVKITEEHRKQNQQKKAKDTSASAAQLRADRAEYERNANYIERLNKALREQKEIQASTKGKGNLYTQSSAAINQTLNEIDRVNRRQQELANANQGKLDDLISKHAAKRANIELQELQKSEQRKTQIAETEARRRQQAYANAAKQYQQGNYARNTTLAGATQFAQSANTLNRLNTALKYLKEAMASTKPNTPEWERANRAYKQTKERIDEIRRSMGDFKEQQSKVLNLSDQLTRKLALVFSVSAIQGYIQQMVKVRAEFELQQIALASILQDKTKADMVFSQVQQLAMQSPFSIMQLNTYTKQVAAYGFEADKLVDTTKRLADVSAGLGVDMARLTLAYGQVKTANYLRATEVRQFTEAGLNITAELAKYFSELRGEMINVADVTNMITKRMVRFEDVEEVFRRITSDGGMFFDMQKKQAEGLAGQIQRIGDAYSIMLNEIGESNQPVISFFLKTIRTLIQNWEPVAVVAKAAALAFAAYTIAATKAAKANGTFTATATGVTGAIFRVTAGFKAMGAALVANPWVLAVTAIAAAGVALWDYADKVREAQKGHEEFSLNLIKQRDDFAELTKHISDNNAKLKESEEALRNAGTNTESLSAAVKENKDLMADQSSTIAKLKNAFPELAESIKQAKDGTVDLSKAIDDFNASSDIQRLMNYNAAKEDTFFGSMFSDNIKEDFKDYSDAMTEVEIKEVDLQSAIDVTRAKIADLIVKRQEMGLEVTQEQKLQEEINKTLASNASVQEKGREILISMNSLYRGQHGDISSLNDAYTDLYDAQKSAARDRAELEREVNTVMLQSIATRFHTTVDKLGELTQIQKEQARDAAADWLEQNQIALDKFTTDLLNRTFRLKVGIDFYVPGVTKEPTTWLQDQIDKYVKDFSTASLANDYKNALPERNTGETAEAYLKRTNTLLKEKKTLLEQTNKATVQLNRNISNKDAARQLQGEINAIEAELKAFGISPDEKKGKKGRAVRDNTIEQARKRFEFFKRANSEYEKLLKYYGKEEAKMRVLNQMRSEAQALSVQKIFTSADFDKEGTIKSVQAVSDMYAKNKKHIKEIRQEAEKIKSPLKIELDFELQQKELDTLSRQIDGIFGGYELYLELDKMGLDKSLMSELFDIDTFSLDEAQEQVDKAFVDMINEQQKRREDGNTKMVKNAKEAYELAGEAERKVYDDTHKKLMDKFNDELESRLKTYAKYLKKSYGERLTAELEAYNKLQDVYSTFGLKSELVNKNEKLSDEQKKQIIGDLESQTGRIAESIKEELQKAIDNVEWTKFKEEPIYSDMFSDLDKVGNATIDLLLSKIESLKTSMKSLDPKIIRQLTEYQDKLTEAKMDISPFKSYIEGLKEVAEFRKQGLNYDKLQQNLVIQQGELDSINKQIDSLDKVLAIKEKQIEVDTKLASLPQQMQEDFAANTAESALAKITEYQDRLSTASEEEKTNLQEQLEYWQQIYNIYSLIGNQRSLTLILTKQEQKLLQQNTQELNKQLSDAKKNKSDKETQISGTQAGIKAYGNLAKAQTKAISKLQQIGDIGNNVMSALRDGIDAFGGGVDDATAATLDGFESIMQSVVQMGIMFVALGVTINSTLGVIGIIATALSAVMTMFSALTKAHDTKIEKRIEAYRKQIERLSRAYDQLEESINAAFSFDQLTSGTKQAQDNLLKQNENYRKMIYEEKGKKKKDADKIQEYYDAIEDNNRKIYELQQEMVNTMGGLATGDAIKSAAEEFVDAWMEAYKETGDGLQGLKESFDEFFVNLVKKQMVSKIADVYISKWAEGLNKAIESGGLVDENEMRQLYKDAEEMLPGISELMKGLLDVMESATGIDVMSQQAGELSGLAKGIQGVTEETALVLESLLNSMRYFVSDTNTQVRQILQMIVNPPADNLFISELKLQTAELKAMNRLLSSVTKSGHPQGGSGLKVFMD